MKRIIIGLACALMVGTLPPAAAQADQFDNLRKKIDKALVDEQVPSLAIAVAKDGKILWEQGFGWADRERRVRPTQHTMYSLASISKPITATGLMLLVQRGDVELDKPGNDYLADSRLVAKIGDVDDATVRRLANHSAGLPLHYQFFYDDEPRAVPDFDESLRRYGVLMSKPGERFQYANFGYGVLDHIIRRKSGLSYAEFMRRELFLPLDLTRTSVHIAPGLEKHVAVRYAADQTRLPFYHFDHPGASAVYSSAHDLARFGMFHLKQRQPGQQTILSDQLIDEMQKPTSDVGDGRQYGVGWFIDKDEFGYHTVSHTGGMGGVRTRLTLLPEEQLVVVALCNYSTDLPLRMTREVLGQLLPKYGENWRKSEAKHEPNAHPPKPYGPPALVGFWVGNVDTYCGSRRLEMWAYPGGDVHVRLAGGLRTLLNNSRLKEGVLTGVFSGDIGNDDANRRPYHLHLRAKLRGETMNGSLTAKSLPGRKAGNALSYWVELNRADTDPRVIAMSNGHTLGGWRVIDQYDFQRHGKVRVEDGAIILDRGNPATGIAWTGEPPRHDYELTLEAKRIEGHDFFCGITFPVKENYLSLIIGGWGGGVTGISNLDGMSAVENETTGYVEFEQDRWYKVRLRVTRQKVEAWVDDEQIVDVASENYKLSIWWEQEPVRPLGIASWHTKAALRDIRLKRLDLAPE